MRYHCLEGSACGVCVCEQTQKDLGFAISRVERIVVFVAGIKEPVIPPCQLLDLFLFADDPATTHVCSKSDRPCAFPPSISVLRCSINISRNRINAPIPDACSGPTTRYLLPTHVSLIQLVEGYNLAISPKGVIPSCKPLIKPAMSSPAALKPTALPKPTSEMMW